MGWHEVLADEGCQLWNTCLGCPLPVCREDAGPSAARQAAEAAGIHVMARTIHNKRGHKAGTAKERAEDAIARGLSVKAAARAGYGHAATLTRWYSKLTDRPGSPPPAICGEALVRFHQLRAEGWSLRRLAIEFHVNPSTARTYVKKGEVALAG